ncbi:hypothetical protein AN2V17_33230 [Vallitalea sp. AN17-2]|uniref:Uncharacterized protein n=1 Tax=Vallitalea maricola TaxID=3074433 RepID=A0ACB5UNN5_9FIRM|nr:hypothetical protein AN2V17_33230 [Vallitalea sp. AN17-2]
MKSASPIKLRMTNINAVSPVVIINVIRWLNFLVLWNTSIIYNNPKTTAITKLFG